MLPRLAATALAIAALTAPARADGNPDLDQARQAIDRVELDRALTSLEAALARGGNAPTELAEIYRLLGEVLVGIGDPARAQDAFAHLLAVTPETELGELVSPKIREVFDAARASAPAGYLTLSHSVNTQSALRITLVRDADPLGMVVAAEVVYRADGKPGKQRSEGEGALGVVLPADRVTDAVLYAVDARGNRVREIELGTLAVPRPAVAPVARGPHGAPAERPADRPLFRTWWPYLTLSGALAVTGVGFTVARVSAKSDLDDILADDESHFFSEAQGAEDRVNRYTAFAITGYALAAVAAAAGAVLVLTAPDGDGRATIAPAASPAGVSLALEVSF